MRARSWPTIPPDPPPSPPSSLPPALAERVERARISKQAAQNAFRFSLLRCTLAGRWAPMGWSPSYPLPRKLVVFRP